MRIVSLHCKTIEIVSIEPALKLELCDHDEAGARRPFANCLFALSTVHPDDNARAATRAAQDLSRLAYENNVRSVVLNPFAHLDDKNAPPAACLPLLDHMTATLQAIAEDEARWDVTRLAFGRRKEWINMHVLSGVFDQRFLHT